MVSRERECEHQQLDLLGVVVTPLPDSLASAPRKPGLGNARDRVCVDLRGLGDRLRVQARRQRTTSAALTRRAVLLLLSNESDSKQPAIAEPACTTRRVVKITLRVSAAHATSLATRARAADISQGAYVSSLLDGMVPAALSADHSSAVKVLMASTDRMAALSADLNAFMRVLGQASVLQLEPYRDSIASLTKDVRQHLAAAAALVAELRHARRPWR